MGELRYSSIILNLGIRWRWVISFTPLSRYLKEKNPRYQFYRRLDEPQSRFKYYGEEKNLLSLPGIELRFLGRPYCSLVAIPTNTNLHTKSHLKYCNGFYQRIARQRLRKHVPTRNNGNCASVDECYTSLLCSSQLANELAGYLSCGLCFLFHPRHAQFW
jgi:hypothetical protein